MVTIVAFGGVVVLLIGLALSAYAIYLTEGSGESPSRAHRFLRSGRGFHAMVSTSWNFPLQLPLCWKVYLC